MYETPEAQAAAVEFIIEHGIDLWFRNRQVDDDGRTLFDVTVANHKGQVTYTKYSMAGRRTLQPDEITMADLVSHTDWAVEYVRYDRDGATNGVTNAIAEMGEETFNFYMGAAETLGAMTGHDTEYLSSVFSTH
jgi:hypothetical protein